MTAETPPPTSATEAVPSLETPAPPERRRANPFQMLSAQISRFRENIRSRTTPADITSDTDSSLSALDQEVHTAARFDMLGMIERLPPLQTEAERAEVGASLFADMIPEPTDEEVARSEVVAKTIIDESDSVLPYPRVPGGRTNQCGYAAELVAKIAEQKNAKATYYQIQHVSDQIGEWENSFGHSFAVINVQGVGWLVDLTYVQFMNPETGHVESGRNTPTDTLVDDPFAQEFVTKGYVRLTDETLREYMRITSKSNTPEFRQKLSSVTVRDTLASTLPLPTDYVPGELEAMIQNAKQ